MRIGLKLLLVTAACTVFAFTTASAAQPAFEANIEITAQVNGEPAAFVGNTLFVLVNDEVELTADWESNREVNRIEWFVDEVSQGSVAIDGADAGSDTFSWQSADEGIFEIRFRIWHHIQDDRDEHIDVVIDVAVPDDVGEYGINGLLAPWAEGKAFKLGSVIPLKWQYTDPDSDEVVESGDFVISVFADLESTLTDPAEVAEAVYAAGNSGHQYDAQTGTHQMNWQTKGWAVGSYTLYIICESDIGTQINTFPIQLKK